MDKREIALLVEKSRQGDNAAFSELYRLTEKQAYYMALKIVKNEDDALDILQDCYIKAMQKMNMLENPENFVSWFNQIVANTTKNFVVKRKPMLFRDDDDESAVMDLQIDDTLDVKPDDSLDTDETRAFIRELVDELPEDKRMCVLMFYFQNMGTAQIAETLGISEGTVKTRLYHSRDKIKQSIEALEKKGVKVIGIAPLPFFIWMLKRMADSAQVSQAASAAIINAATSSAAAGAASATATATTATATTASATVATSAATTATAKIIAIAVAGAMAVGGGAIGVKVALDRRGEELTTVQVGELTGNTAVEDGATASISDDEAVCSGICGDNLVWSLYEDTGLLHITGTGAMTDYGVESFAPWVRYNLRIKSVRIDNGVTTIGDEAFGGCHSLTSVTIPDSTEIIGDGAFGSCSALGDVTIPGSVKTIGNGAFAYCDNLTSVTIENGVTTIGEDAFKSCESLTGIVIPDSVTTVGKNAFSLCQSLKSAVIGNNVKVINDGMFSWCTNLTSVTIGNSVTIIGEDAFNSCESLTSIAIPDSVTTIGNRCFQQCNSLINVAIGNGVTTIGEGAFSFCTALTKVTIPYGVTAIRKDTFAFCSNLEYVALPDSVTDIDIDAFAGTKVPNNLR